MNDFTVSISLLNKAVSCVAVRQAVDLEETFNHPSTQIFLRGRTATAPNGRYDAFEPPIRGVIDNPSSVTILGD